MSERSRGGGDHKSNKQNTQKKRDISSSVRRSDKVKSTR